MSSQEDCTSYWWDGSQPQVSCRSHQITHPPPRRARTYCRIRARHPHGRCHRVRATRMLRVKPSPSSSAGRADDDRTKEAASSGAGTVQPSNQARHGDKRACTGRSSSPVLSRTRLNCRDLAKVAAEPRLWADIRGDDGVVARNNGPSLARVAMSQQCSIELVLLSPRLRHRVPVI